MLVVDEEIYRRLPALLIATVDKFAQMPWKGEAQMLFGQVNGYCPRHGYRSPEIDDTDSHPPTRRSAGTERHNRIGPLRPPDLIIQDELHLISGPLGTLVGLYETAVDQLCSWTVDGRGAAQGHRLDRHHPPRRRPGSKAVLRRWTVFPAQGTGRLHDNFFARQRPPGDEYPGRRYLGVCAPLAAATATLIRVYRGLSGARRRSLSTVRSSRRSVDDPGRLFQFDPRTGRHAPCGGRRYPLPPAQCRSARAWPSASSPAVEELTSRKSATDIPRILERLESASIRSRLQQREADRKAGKKPLHAPALRCHAGHQHDFGRRRCCPAGPDGGRRAAQDHRRIHPGHQPRRAFQTVPAWSAPSTTGRGPATSPTTKPSSTITPPSTSTSRRCRSRPLPPAPWIAACPG